MEIDNISIILGLFFMVAIIIFRICKLKKKFIDKIEIMTTFGYFTLAFISAVLIVNMINLASLTWSNELTLELIQKNKPYVFFSWCLIATAGIIAFISLLLENKKT